MAAIAATSQTMVSAVAASTAWRRKRHRHHHHAVITAAAHQAASAPIERNHGPVIDAVQFASQIRISHSTTAIVAGTYASDAVTQASAAVAYPTTRSRAPTGIATIESGMANGASRPKCQIAKGVVASHTAILATMRARSEWRIASATFTGASPRSRYHRSDRRGTRYRSARTAANVN